MKTKGMMKSGNKGRRWKEREKMKKGKRKNKNKRMSEERKHENIKSNRLR